MRDKNNRQPDCIEDEAGNNPPDGPQTKEEGKELPRSPSQNNIAHSTIQTTSI